MLQFLLFSLSITAVYLSQHELENKRKFACIAGLLSEPLWFITTWGSWGMFGITIIYTIIWARSFYKNFIRK